ncbi:MAG TPA: glycosyltransferase family 1 protein [Thermoanaerobaculia bacterium]|nr:glycosyltransferase family 1 protein [Thermoanaerobaculia bacterium]
MPPTIAIDARKLRDFGIGTYVRGLVRHLAALDRTTRYVLLVRPEDRGALQGLPANFTESPEPARVYSVREAFTVASHLRRLHADLYHATHYTVPLWPPCPVVVTVHDVIHLRFPELLPSRRALHYARFMLRRATRRSRRVIAVSHATQDDLVEMVGADPARLRVIHNGVDEVFSQRLGREEISRRLAAHGVGPPYLLFVGNPKAHKNLERLLEGYARARRLLTEPPPPLVIAGARAGGGSLRAKAEELGVGGSLVIAGWIPEEDLPALYQGATLFVYPSLYEGFGLPVLEAMASGTAVVTSRGSALLEVAGDSAELVDPWEPDDLARGIACCLGDEPRRRQLEERGRQRAAQFGWDRVAAATLEVYREALEDAG